MQIDEKIFKKYDIRGIYPQEINRQAAYSISRAFTDFLKDFYGLQKPKIVLGYDIRKSSGELKEAAIKGLLESGAEVINIGLCSTPLNYFGNWFLKADGSLMITASHNSKEYNGIKFSLKAVSAPVEVGAEEKIKQRAMRGEFKDGYGDLFKKNLLSDYISFLNKEAEAQDFSSFKIAVDCGNGMVGREFETLAEVLNLNYQGLFMEPDGDFPNHEPNPLNEEARIPLKNLMQQKDFDLGVMFDGDGDRIVVFDSSGQAVRTDFIIGLFAQYSVLEKNNFKIPCDSRISRGVKEEIKKIGGEILPVRVGYPYVRKRMREEKSLFGAELSGHFFWQDFSYSESPLLSLIRLLKILKQKNQPLEELIKPFQKYFSTEEINFQVQDKELTLKKVEKEYSNGEISLLDGVTVNFEDWWFNLRPSGTEPLIRLKVEAKSKQLLEEKVSELTNIIKGA